MWKQKRACFRPRQPDAGRCGTPLMRCQERKVFVPRLISEFPPKVGHSICLSWLVRGRSGFGLCRPSRDFCKSMVLGKGRVPYTTCCMYSRAKLPSHHLPHLFGSLVLVPAVLVFSLSIWVASRKTCCTRLLPCHLRGSLGSATLVVPGTGLVRPSSLALLSLALSPTSWFPRRVSSTAVNIPEARAAPAWIGSRPRSVSTLSGSRCG